MDTNEISPRRFPRSPTVTPPRWRKPQDVMRTHKVRLKENALLARISNTSPKSPFKRKNPFRAGGIEVLKKPKAEKPVGEDSLFEIFGASEPETPAETSIPPIVTDKTPNELQTEEPTGDSLASLPLDWTLRTKIRFISAKPLPWSLTLKTCEEASGITGFVRCIDMGSESGVDTSPNGQFHQSCLVWIQPNLPWLQVYPRHNLRKSGKPSPTLSCPQVKDALHKEWAKSFRSLCQLVRARHCPYFYMTASTFTCLFRAAGINGTREMNAIICPTTKGMRKLLADDGISYSEPLRMEKRESTGGTVEEEEEEERMDEDEGDWLNSLGIPQVAVIEERRKEEAVKPDVEESLVRVDGCNVQALLNFLINSKSVVETSGPLSGVPPTLLAPVAFPGGTLTPLTVSENRVTMDGERFHTLEVRGPILPSTVLNLISILNQQLETFSVAFANVEPTKSFSLVKEEESVGRSPEKGCSAFDKGALTDSGLDSDFLSVFCSSDLRAYDSIRYSGSYHLS